MRLSYHPDNDSLYLHLKDKPGVDVVELAENVAVDVDDNGVPVGIDIDANASEIVDLSRLDLDGVFLESVALTSEPRNQKTAS